MTERFREDPDCLALILGGSIPKGLARVDSDIDVMLVVSEATLSRYREERRLSFLLWDICDYPGGYVDAKVVTRAFLEAAEREGSEPARNAFVAATILFSRDETLGYLVERIGVYPQHLQRERIVSFYSQMAVMRVYFWPHAVHTADLYLKTRSASEIVLYGYRLLLAHNRVLFPNHKALSAAVAALPQKPNNIIALADEFLAQQSESSMAAFCDSIESFTDWGITRKDWSLILTQFVTDAEHAWLTHTPALSDI